MDRRTYAGEHSLLARVNNRKKSSKRSLQFLSNTFGLCFLCVNLVSSSFADDPPSPEKNHITAVRINRNIDLTGTLSDPMWKLSSPVELKYEVLPGENTPARQKTFVYLLYNADYVYFGFGCPDSSANHIRANLTDRDQMMDDDFVGILLDTYGTMQGAYELFVNPYAIQADAMRTGNKEDFSFDCVWYSSAHMSEGGYTAEFAIPIKSLRFPSTREQHWMLNLIRNMPRESRYQMTWTTIDRNNPCILCQSGTIEGIEGINSSDNFELLPYAMGVQSGSMNDIGDPTSRFTDSPLTGRVGAGLKYAPSSTFAIAGVLNPDFGEVESDATQISINNTFAIFYPEKRPFFLEGADLFSTSASIFYSRMINDPLVSAKMTQKSGSFSVAYLGAEDRQSPFIIPGEEGSDFVSSNLRSWSNVLRGKYLLGKESFIGGLLTTRNFSNAHNYVGTVDWNFLFGGNYYLSGQAGLSNTKEINNTDLFSSDRRLGSTHNTASLDGESYSGSGLQVDFARNARNYSFDLGVVGVSPDFQAQDGFITSNDFRQITYYQDYAIYFDNAFIESLFLETNSGVKFNSVGARKFVGSSIQVKANLKGQTFAYVYYYPLDEELFHGVQFRNLYRTEAFVSMKPFNSFAFNVWAQIGRLIYRADTPELGRGYNMSTEIVLKPTHKLSFDLIYARSRLWSYEDNHLFFDGYIARAAAVYQFSSELFARLICQYDQFGKQLQLDPLISFKLNPFTIFYVGSDHNFTNFDQPYGWTKTVRQFFVKLQYLWQS
jgi:hypothetical protein